MAPGEKIAFMVSSELPKYRADIVQLIHGDTNPAGPGFKVRVVTSGVSGEYPGNYERLNPGSYVLIPYGEGLDLDGSFTIQMWIRPTTPAKPVQTLVSAVGVDGAGFAVRLTNGRLTIQLGRTPTVAILQKRVTSQTWYSVSVVYDRPRGKVRVALEASELTATRLSAVGTLPLQGSARSGGADVLIGAEQLSAGRTCEVGNFYNGKIDTPKIYARALSENELESLRDGTADIPDGLLASWDFAQDISSSRITDVSGNGYHGRTVNRPTRAVVSHTWDGSELAWKNSPAQYAAIHFHDDDLDDAGWKKSLEWIVPEGTPSAIYALHVQAEGEEDYLPFAVRPKPGDATAKMAFLMPTFSYLAYGNNHMAGRPEMASLAKMMGATRQGRYPESPEDKYVVANRLNSLYDTHTDGSGCYYASWLRPIVSMRPKYVSEMMGIRGPRQLGADLYLIDWLVEHGYRFDVIADENLHREGPALLEPYKVVLTGTHPEYCSEQMIRAWRQYLHHGGRMMYLGGNGMYWVTQLDPEFGHTIEMRRAQPSSPRFFEPHPGELHLSTTGQRAAPWRNRGLPTQEWLGVAMSGAGRTGQHFVRQPDSFDERVAWIFQGIAKNEPIGNFRSLYTGYGAVGGEVDRVNFKLEGTPHHTTVLATNAPFDQSWFWDPLDQPNIPRSDLALLEYPKGGAVFSASSIAWCSCLSYNDYSNNVSQLTRNVLDGFLNRQFVLSCPS